MVLLDTHVLLWLLFNDDKLSRTATDALKNNTCCISMASFWELSIKISLGKLKLPKSLVEIAEVCDNMGIEVCSITLNDCLTLQRLPWIHRDPFDRIIISHALTEGLPLVSHDGIIQKYSDLEVIW